MVAKRSTLTQLDGTTRFEDNISRRWDKKLFRDNRGQDVFFLMSILLASKPLSIILV
jgi:hypothetical protein